MDYTAFQATRDAHNKKLPVVNQTPALCPLFSQAVEQTYSQGVEAGNNRSLAIMASVDYILLNEADFPFAVGESF